MDRNTKGIIGWSIITILLIVICSLIFGNVISVLLPIAITELSMCGRELWQYKTKQSILFEWDDIMRYSMTILFSAVITTFIMVFIGIVE